MVDAFNAMLKAWSRRRPKATIELVRDAVSLVTDYIVEDDVLRFHDLCERPKKYGAFLDPGTRNLDRCMNFREQWQLPFIAEYDLIG